MAAATAYGGTYQHRSVATVKKEKSEIMAAAINGMAKWRGAGILAREYSCACIRLHYYKPA